MNRKVSAKHTIKTTAPDQIALPDMDMNLPDSPSGWFKSNTVRMREQFKASQKKGEDIPRKTVIVDEINADKTEGNLAQRITREMEDLQFERAEQRRVEYESQRETQQ